MKRVKLMSVALLMLSVLSLTSVSAQPQPQSSEDRAKMVSERMTKQLDLTEDQSSKIYDITLKYAEEQDAKREQMKADREQKREQRGENAEGGRPMRRPEGAPQQRPDDDGRKAQMKEIIALLNVDQIVEYIEMQSRRGNQQGGRPQPQHGQRRGQHQPPHQGNHQPPHQGRPDRGGVCE